ncbi:hypothetical protein SOCE26_092140 [Sorangium cellulosum]|uniref:Nitroreductase domain-containing protein n=1 Tax=Sorangium cellulosum TaxID=56 RepID=A0A2L0F7Z8_SORCE|nr:nitroreductase family protein [Sorangium cellulosum]AUX47690.1 hypothetical protein SOCE26_092140 [Sorangium cellulosum]
MSKVQAVDDSLFATTERPWSVVAAMIEGTRARAAGAPLAPLTPECAAPWPPARARIALPEPSPRPGDGRTVAELLRARRSGGLAPEGLALAPFATLLSVAGRDVAGAFFLDAKLAPHVCPVVFDVEGIAPGAYRYRPDVHALEALGPADRAAVRDDVLLQWEHGGAAALLFLVVPLASWLRRYGDRGYRAAAMSAGWVADRLYVAAEHLGLTYSASGGFAPAKADELFGLDRVERTCFFAFVVGGARRRAAGTVGGAQGAAGGGAQP